MAIVEIVAIDITLINLPSKKAPKKASFLAQENQQASGKKSKKPKPPSQQIPSQGESQIKHIRKAAAEKSEPKAVKKLLTQKQAEKKVFSDSVGNFFKSVRFKSNYSYQSTLQNFKEVYKYGSNKIRTKKV